TISRIQCGWYIPRHLSLNRPSNAVASPRNVESADNLFNRICKLLL
ncbi:unnamed protein product, partial [Arabidopsis halleri]